MKKVSWSCIIIGVMSIGLSVIGIFFPLDNKFVGCNLPFQFLLVWISFNKGPFVLKILQLPFFDYVLSIILITSGIGTIWQKYWGRTFAYIYAIFMIVFSIIFMPISFIGYVIKEFILTGRGSPFSGLFMWMAIGHIFLLPFAVLLYPIVLLTFFSRPQIKEMFRKL